MIIQVDQVNEMFIWSKIREHKIKQNKRKSHN